MVQKVFQLFHFLQWTEVLKKTVEMLDFHRKEAHGKAMISSSFARYDLKSLIEGDVGRFVLRTPALSLHIAT